MNLPLDYRGEDRTAEKLEDATRWSPSAAGEAREPLARLALAELLGVPPGETIPLGTKIVEQLPSDATRDRGGSDSDAL